MSDSKTTSLFCKSQHLKKAIEESATPLPVQDLRDRISQIEQFPPLPAITREILSLRGNPQASTETLARIIEKDPALSLQVIRWSNSALYGSRSEITSVNDAIIRVLGFDLVMNLAVGLTTMAPLNMPKDGPIGLQAYWSDALYTAMLCKSLAKYVNGQQHPQPGTAYVSGLLHNIGLALFAHLFPTEHRALNNILAANPDLCFTELSEYALGINPIVISRWLLEDWDLPTTLRTAIVHQADPIFHGMDSIYPNLVLIASHALAPHQLSGFTTTVAPPPELLTLLDIDQETIVGTTEQLMMRQQELSSFANQLIH